VETDFGSNYTQATPENDPTGTYQDSSNSYTRDSEVDQANRDFANFQDFSRASPKDTRIEDIGGGAGDFGFGLNRNAGKGIEGIDPTYQSNFQTKDRKGNNTFLNKQMVDYYTKSRGATATNPFPESFWSKLVGVENVNYGKHMEWVNDLRARQAFNLPTLSSMKRAEKTDGTYDSSELKEYDSGDYYIGQNTNRGEVKPVPSIGRDILNFFPGGGIINALTGQPGLPERDPRYQEIMNEPGIFSGIIGEGKDFLNDLSTGVNDISTGIKDLLSFGNKDGMTSKEQGELRDKDEAIKEEELNPNIFNDVNRFVSSKQSTANNTNPIYTIPQVITKELRPNFPRQRSYLDKTR